jgi:hypothetical protein
MNEIISYFQPHTDLSITIVRIICGLSVFWLATLIYQTAGLMRAALSIRSYEKAAAKLQQRQREVLETKISYRDVVRELGLPPRTAIANHVKIIFDAGVKESRLDTGELISVTEQSLLNTSSVLRYLLSVFVVLGLLGTLLGLIGSSRDLAGAIERTGDVHDALRQILQNLGAAFVPSVWGVFCSIAGTSLLALHQGVVIGPVIARLQKATISTWIPLFYPTAGQRMLEATQRSLAAVEKVAAFSEEVQKDSGRFRRALRRAVEETELFDRRLASVKSALETADRVLIERLRNLNESATSVAKLFEQRAEQEVAFRSSVEDVGGAALTLTRQVESLGKAVSSQNEHLELLKNERQTFNQEIAELRQKLPDLANWLNEKAAERAEQLALAGAAASASLADASKQAVKELSDEIAREAASLDAAHQNYASALNGSLDEWKNLTAQHWDRIERERQAFNQHIGELGGKLDASATWLNEQAETRARELQTAATEASASIAAAARAGAKELQNEIERHASALGGAHERYAASLRDALSAWQEIMRPRLETMDEHLTSLRNDVDGLATQVGRFRDEVGGLRTPFALAAESIQNTVTGFATTSERWLREIAEAVRSNTAHDATLGPEANGKPSSVPALLAEILAELKSLNRDVAQSSPAKSKGLFGFWRE